MSVAAVLAQIVAMRAGLDALETAVHEIEHASPADELLSRANWPGDLPCTWRAARESGEIPIHKAGRTPCMKRSDVLAWIAKRAIAPKKKNEQSALVAGEENTTTDDYAACVADEGRH